MGWERILASRWHLASKELLIFGRGSNLTWSPSYKLIVSVWGEYDKKCVAPAAKK